MKLRNKKTNAEYFCIIKYKSGDQKPLSVVESIETKRGDNEKPYK